MAFKASASFLQYLTIGAVGVRRVMNDLRHQGFEPIVLERLCASNKIWATKVKRLRLPDLLCVKTGMRVEVRAKTKLEIRMSDSPNDPDRVWDAGLRDNDIVALLACSYTEAGVYPANHTNYFTVDALRRSVEQSGDDNVKSPSEGAERYRTWRATVPTQNGRVLEVSADRLLVQMHAGAKRKSRKQPYLLKGKTAYVGPGEEFEANVTILAGAPATLADLSVYASLGYEPLDDLDSENDLDRYAAVKAIRYLGSSDLQVIKAVEKLIQKEEEPRVALEATGCAAALGSELGQSKLLEFISDGNDDTALNLEAVFILTELGNSFARDQLITIASDPRLRGDERRQAAVWGLGKAGVRSYKDLLPFICDMDEGVAYHAICAFDSNTPSDVLESLVGDLVSGHPRRAPAASLTLRTVASESAVQSLVAVAGAADSVPDWIIATLGLMPEQQVRRHVDNPALLERLTPLFLTSKGSNWLSSETATSDVSFLANQNIW